MALRGDTDGAERQRRYRASKKGALADARYRKSGKRTVVLERYAVSDKGKACRKRYKHTAAGKEQVAKSNAGFKRNNPKYWRCWSLRRYGADFTIETYAKMLEEQGGRCKLCPRTEAENTHGVLCVDHCHTTGRVRGLLCSPCNRALGTLGDSVEALRRVVEYLE